jgi:hypothetical protein
MHIGLKNYCPLRQHNVKISMLSIQNRIIEKNTLSRSSIDLQESGFEKDELPSSFCRNTNHHVIAVYLMG